MSLKDIAARSGVSVSTVSRILNDASPTCASAPVKERVWQAARELGYAPDMSARRLKKGGSLPPQAPVVAVIVTRANSLEQDPFFSELGRCLDVELCAAGCALGPRLTAEEAAAGRLKAVDGVVVLGRCPEELPALVRQVTGAMVAVSRNPRDFDVDEVVCDGKKAAELAISHLARLGHRRIAYMGGCSDEDRYAGYCEALLRRQFPLDYQIIVPAEQSEAAGYQAMEALLDRGRFTAVFCAGDILALGAKRALSRRDKTARPISLISIDDIEAAGAALLTTVAIPIADMAHAAISLLMDRLAGGHSTCLRVEAPCRLAVRDSCYPA